MAVWDLEPEDDEELAHRRLMHAFYGLGAGEGFEPPQPVRVDSLSRGALSATQPSCRRLH